MIPKVSGELAVLIQVVGHPLLELVHFFGTFEQRRIDFADSDEDHVAELAREQLMDLQQGTEPQTIKAADQDRGRWGIGIALGGLTLFDRVQLRQNIGFELLDCLRNPFVMAAHSVAQRDQPAGDYYGHPSALEEFERQRDEENGRREE